MKALSLTEAWAVLCVLLDSEGKAEKQFETRGWKPSDKMMREIGDRPIAIHAAKSFPKAARRLAISNPYFNRSLFHGNFAHVDQLPLGAIVGTVEIYRFVRTEEIRRHLEPKELAFGHYLPGRWAWQFINPIALKNPIPCKGALSLWDVPEEIEARIRENF